MGGEKRARPAVSNPARNPQPVTGSPLKLDGRWLRHVVERTLTPRELPIETLLRDVRLSLKRIVKEKTFSATVLITLAICIGANVTIFSVIQTVLLEPLPFYEADRLVTINNSYPGAGVERASNGSTDFFFRRERIAAFQEVAAFQGSGNTVGEAGSTERVASLRVTPSFFPLLGIELALGRGFTEDEMDVGNHQKVVLTHGYWQEYFGGGADVLGRELRVGGLPFTVVGVLPEDFRMVGREDIRLLLPIPFTEGERTLENWHSNSFQLMARLRPGATIEQARAQNDALNAAMIEEWPVPNAAQILADAQFSTQLTGAQEDVVRDIRSTLYMLWAGVAFVLLIGCVNIANLMMARSQARMSELATKLALGAQRIRIARQVLTEAAVLGLVGGVLGIGVGALGLRVLTAIGVDNLPRGGEISLNGTVLLFTAALALGASIVFGIIPVAHVMRNDLSAVFRSESRTGTASKRAVLVRSFLVSGEVGLAFVLLIGAGLMFMSFRAALSVEPGFQPNGVLTASVSLPEARYPDASARRQFTDELLREVRAIPGVQSADVTSQLPFSGNNSSSVIFPEGYVPDPGESLLSPFQTRVGPEYFDVMGIGLLEGRVFTESDASDRTKVIVIDEWLANRYWPDGSALGERLTWGVIPGSDEVSEDQNFTVIGVVENIKQNDLTESAAEHVGSYYFTYRQNPISFLTLVVRTVTPSLEVAPEVRQVLSRIAPEMPLFGVQSMDDRIAESLVSRRVPLMLLLVFAGVALFLAVIGIYGALAYSVAQRTREIGIRLAMGSTLEEVFRLVVGQGLRVIGVGLILGVVSALGLARLLQSLLYGIQSTDLRVMGVVAVTLAVVGLVACVVPALRATKVDPVSALTYQ